MDSEINTLLRRLMTNDLDALPALVNMLNRLGLSIREIYDTINEKMTVNLESIWDCLKNREVGMMSELLLAIDSEIVARNWVTNHYIAGMWSETSDERKKFRRGGIIGYASNFSTFPKPFYRNIWYRSLEIPGINGFYGNPSRSALFLEDENYIVPEPVIALGDIIIPNGSSFTKRVPITLDNYQWALDKIAELAIRIQAGDTEASGFGVYQES